MVCFFILIVNINKYFGFCFKFANLKFIYAISFQNADFKYNMRLFIVNLDINIFLYKSIIFSWFLLRTTFISN